VLNQIVPWIWHVVIDVTCCQEERTWCCAQEAAPRGQLLIKCEFLIYQKNLSLSACMDITQYNLIIRSLLFEICTITCGHSVTFVVVGSKTITVAPIFTQRMLFQYGIMRKCITHIYPSFFINLTISTSCLNMIHMFL
jgi:hypothetical protein